MTDELIFQINLYSPKWGTSDEYEFQFGQKQIKIVRNESYVLYTETESIGPEWSAPANFAGHALLNMLEVYDIFPPTIFVGAIVSAWKAWKNKEISDKRVVAEIKNLCKWDKVSERKPKTKFWRSKF